MSLASLVETERMVMLDRTEIQGSKVTEVTLDLKGRRVLLERV